MSKNQFLKILKRKLSHLSKSELDERINFYSEMIDDRIESGLSEKEAVNAIGSADMIARQIAEELKQGNKNDEYSKSEKGNAKKGMSPWVIALLIIGSPIWLSILIAVAAVILSLFIAVWSVIISLWAVFGSLVGAGAGIAIAGIYLLINVKAVTGIAFICAGIACLGLSIFFFFACKALTSAVIALTKKLFLSIFMKKKGDR